MAMTVGERLRLRFLYGLLGAVPVFLAGWLGWLQVLHAGQLQRAGRAPLLLTPDAADRQRDRTAELPSPRGTIVDRHGATLAIDREAFEVRAEVRPPKRERASAAALGAWLDRLADQFAAALTSDPGLADRGVALQQCRGELRARLRRAFQLPADAGTGPLPAAVPVRAECLVDPAVDVLSVVAALQQVDDDSDAVLLHLRHRFLRRYPEREVTYGLVGHRLDLAVHDPESGRLLGFHSHAPAGLEAMAALVPGAPGRRPYMVDATSLPFFAGAGLAPAPASRVETTIDLELQKAACRLLERQALAAADGGRGTLPQWGALVLVAIETGDVLAAASWHRDAMHKQGAAFAPYQLLYEPGSIVKPLVFAWALQHAGLDWQQKIDCRSSGADHHRLVAEANDRLIRDDHACDVLTPHEVLTQSSNIGSTIVGARFSRDDWAAYLEYFGFGRPDPTGAQPPAPSPLGLPLPHERVGVPARKGWQRGVSAAAFKKWSGASYSMGYELQVNALQMARAYLALLAGRQRPLRLVRQLEVDGRRHVVPPDTGGAQELDPGVVETVRAAMIDVVSNNPGATGRFLVDDFRREEIELHGLIAGKTGTAASQTTIPGKGTVEVRNASFVGIAPASSARYLAVCVLQKDDSARFYGGSYAAPPVARLLLEALRLEQRRQLRREPQVSASPGASGRSPRTPERSQAGR